MQRNTGLTNMHTTTKTAYRDHSAIYRVTTRDKALARVAPTTRDAIKRASAVYGSLPFAASKLPRGMPAVLLARGLAAPCGNTQQLRITPAGLRYAGIIA